MKREIAPLVVLASMLVMALVPNARAAEDKRCTMVTLQGDYLFRVLNLSRSDRPDPRRPLVAAGVRTFDGEGNLSQVTTASAGGQITRRVVEVGTYTLDSDCTGIMAIRGTDGVVRNWDIFVATDGNEGVGTGTNTAVPTIAQQTFNRSTPLTGDSH